MEELVFEMESGLVNYIIILTFSLLFFILGWAMPRGSALKRLQGKIFKRFYNWTGAVMVKFHNFFADEEFYLEHVWQDTKDYVRKKYGYEKKKTKSTKKK